MIIRIIGDGQYEVPDTYVDELNYLDEGLDKALADNSQSDFTAQLGIMISAIHQRGRRLDDNHIVESDAVLPAQDATLDEVRKLLVGDDLIPG